MHLRLLSSLQVVSLFLSILFFSCLCALNYAQAESYSSLSTKQNVSQNPSPDLENYDLKTVIDSGHKFFGDASGGFAKIIEHAFSRFGRPNAYILGEEGAGAFFAGALYGEGYLYFKNQKPNKIFWQGPSIGWDFGGEGSRVMILVYNLKNVSQFWARYGGVSGSAYLLAGFGLNVLYHDKIILVPIRTGVGARIGINFNYLKFTASPTWNPF